MSDAKTANGSARTTEAGLPTAEREAEPAPLGPVCPEACRSCPQGCAESALIGQAVIQPRCRRRLAGETGSLFNLPGCPLCREARENHPVPPAKAPASWRKGFRG